MDAFKTCPACKGPLGSRSLRQGTALAGMVLEGKYELVEFMNEGGMGWIYRGKHLGLGHDVAIKLMKPDTSISQHRVERFKREALAVSLLNHPHIISITDFGQTKGGLLFFASELIRGESLHQILQREGPLPFHRVLRIFAQLLAAVEDAHGQHVIHRDLKPENIMVTRLRSGDDFIKVLDFGIAKVNRGAEAAVTLAGEVCGTPSYMAPEQIRGRPPSVQTDIYSLGVLVYELLTGQLPFLGQTVEETLSMHLYEDRPSLLKAVPSSAGVPPGLEDVFLRMVSIDLEQRYNSVQELREGLFTMVPKSHSTSLPCTACRRPHDSPMGLCSSHCAQPYEELTYYLEEAPEDEQQGTSEEPTVGAHPARILDALDEQDIRRASTTSRPAELDSMDSLEKVLSLADTLSSLQNRLRLDTLETHDLLGRKHVLAAVDRFFDGANPVLELLGPPGVGRTAVLARVENLALSRGYRVLRADMDPTLSATPWHPVRQLVIQALGLVLQEPTVAQLHDSCLRAGLLEQDVSGVVSLFQLGRVFKAEDTTLFHRECSASAIRAILRGLSAGEKVCLLLDDVSSYDGATIFFIKELAGLLDGSRVKAVLVGEASVLSLDTSPASISLPPLKLVDVDRMFSALAGNASDASVKADVRRIAEESMGMPLHAQQAILDYREGGVLSGGSLIETVIRRLDRLSPGARAVLEAVAVMGRAAPARLMEAMDIPPASLPALRQELVDRALLQAQPDDPLTISHLALARVIHDAIPEHRRRQLHERAFSVLEGEAAPITTRARHAFEAHLGRRALNLLERAGDLSDLLLDHVGAGLGHFPRALHVARWEMEMSNGEPRYRRLMLKLIRSLRLAGHLLSSELALEEALATATQTSAHSVELLLESGRLLAARGQHDNAIEQIREAIKQGLTLGKPDLLVHCYLDLAEVHREKGSAAEARKELEEGVLMVSSGDGAEGAQGIQGFWNLLLTLAEVQEQDGALEQARSNAWTALKHATREGSTQGMARADRALARLHQAAGLESLAGKHIDSAIPLFHALGDRRSLAECLLLKARQPGEFSRGDLARAAMDLAEQVHWKEGMAEAQRIQGPTQ